MNNIIHLSRIKNIVELFLKNMEKNNINQNDIVMLCAIGREIAFNIKPNNEDWYLACKIIANRLKLAEKNEKIFIEECVYYDNKLIAI